MENKPIKIIRLYGVAKQTSDGEEIIETFQDINERNKFYKKLLKNAIYDNFGKKIKFIKTTKIMTMTLV